jgi:hypothetical protein
VHNQKVRYGQCIRQYSKNRRFAILARTRTCRECGSDCHVAIFFCSWPFRAGRCCCIAGWHRRRLAGLQAAPSSRLPPSPEAISSNQPERDVTAVKDLL